MNAGSTAQLDIQTSSSSTLARLDLLIGDRRRLIVLLAIISIVSAVCEAALLTTVALVAASIVGKGNHHHVSSHSGLLNLHASVHALLWFGLGVAVVRLALQWPISELPARIAADVQQGLRRRIVRTFLAASWDIQSRDKEGQLQEVMTSQTSQATGGALQATNVITSSITFLILMGSAVALNPLAAGIVFVIALGMFVVLRPLRSLGARRSRELSAAQIRYAGGIAEANRLAQETQVFGVAGAQEERARGLIVTCRDLFFRSQLIGKLVPNVYTGLINLFFIVALWILHNQSQGRAGAIGAVVLVLFRGAQNGQSIQSSYQALQQSLPFIDRLENAEKRYADSAPINGDRALGEVRTLAFDRVSFSYNPGRPVLSDISFAVREGEAIGIVGPSGAGKSTLVQILLQLRDTGAGRYLVNDEEVKEFSRTDWQKLVSYVPQEPRLLHGTVTENIRFFRDIPQEDVERAARLARIHDDTVEWANGYDTVIGPRADAISGGQQQRVCLARALAARPHVLILDEPTSALDPQSETLIQESLTTLKSELTMFIVAHRMSTLDMCDRVMVILDGALAAFDTRAALQQNNDYYRRALTIAGGGAGGNFG